MACRGELNRVGRPQLWIPLLCINVLLAVSHLGYLRLSDAGAAITLLHIPAILAGLLCGPLPGALVGLVFGLSSYLEFPPHDPVVTILPRVLVGVVAYLVFQAVQRTADQGSRLSLGAVAGALAGSLTNTLLVTILALLKRLYPVDQLMGMAFLHGSIEAVLAVIVSVPIVVALHHRS